MDISKCRLRIAAGVMAILALASCSSSDEGGGGSENASVTIGSVTTSNVTETSFDAAADVKISGASASAAGFCYSQQQNPTTADPKAVASVTSGKISATISSLTSGTQYYVRAYAVVNGQVTYSPQATVTTEASQSTSVTPPEIEAYRGPNYPDDYRTLADWGKRAQWNLANVHDPTVMLAAVSYTHLTLPTIA